MLLWVATLAVGDVMEPLLGKQSRHRGQASTIPYLREPRSGDWVGLGTRWSCWTSQTILQPCHHLRSRMSCFQGACWPGFTRVKRTGQLSTVQRAEWGELSVLEEKWGGAPLCRSPTDQWPLTWAQQSSLEIMTTEDHCNVRWFWQFKSRHPNTVHSK